MAEQPTLKLRSKTKKCGGGEVVEEGENVFVSAGCSNGLTPDRYGPNYPIWRSVKRDWQHNHSFQFALKPYSLAGPHSNGMLM